MGLDSSGKWGPRANGGETRNVRKSNNMSTSKKPSKASAHRKIKDLKAKTNPKGGSSSLITARSLGSLGSVIANPTSGGGSKVISISKETDSASPNLFSNAIG
jgi:hypothetical protein